MINTTVSLDNPIWHALNHQHAALALGDDLARRYPRDVAPFGAVIDDDERAYERLAALVAPEEIVTIMGSHPAIGDQWALLRELSLIQMIYEGASPDIEAAEMSTPITTLTLANVPAMLQLVEIAHPGPFMQRTIELGHYMGIWQDGQLAAMAGERFHLPGYREISAVCTHPDYQRRGYAQQLIRQLVGEITGAGEVPFLHLTRENERAQALYAKLGFTVRAEVTLYILKRL